MNFCAYKLYCNELSAETNARSDFLSFFLSFLTQTQQILIFLRSKEGEDVGARWSTEA
jgi:hypothetical protein